MNYGKALGAMSLFIAVAVVPALVTSGNSMAALMAADAGLGLSGVAHMYGWSGNGSTDARNPDGH